MISQQKEITTGLYEDLVVTLKDRFENHGSRHKGLDWLKVQKKLNQNAGKLKSLFEMENSGGEPDVVDYDNNTDEFIFVDCSPESPEGRRNTCYDNEAQVSRKENKPPANALDMAKSFGIEILDEVMYRKLQTIGEFDTKTSSWINTPADIRKAGGALFADRRYGHVFIYHNSAPSYYSSRGFRGMLRV